MMENDQVFIERLCDEDPRFRLLYEEHDLLDRQLDMLCKKPVLNAEQEIFCKELKKRKLAGRDAMEKIIHSYRQ